MTQRTTIAAFGIVLVAAVAGGYFWTQSRAPKPIHTGTPYDAISVLPDWSGAWEPEAVPSVLQTDADIPLTPAFAEKLAALRAGIKAGGAMPANPHCRPKGMPLFMDDTGALFDIVVAPGQRIVFGSGRVENRVVYNDGRALPNEHAIDYFDGHSVGHWDGDTLVVDTVNIIPEVDVFPGIPSGGGLRVNERIRLTGPDALEDQITLTGPNIFTKPYSYTRHFTRHREWEVSDYVCLDRTNAIDYGAGPKAAKEDPFVSTQDRPPVRRVNSAPQNAAALPGGTWESIAKLPDWPRTKGLWVYDRNPPEDQRDDPIPMRPPYDARLAELRVIGKTGGDIPTNNYHCWPRGALQSMKAAQANFFFVFTPGQVTLVPFDQFVRRIFTDGRSHPAQMELSFNGHSIGHWEGDALVVDTVGLRPDMQIYNGMNSGGGMRVSERFHSIAANKLQIDYAVDAPAALTEPWKYTKTYSFKPDLETMEDYCAQNNRDVNPSNGFQTFDLTPPPEGLVQ